MSRVSIQQWQYKKSDGTFAAFPTTNNPSITSPTLIVAANESDIWLNDRTAVIKVLTSDSNVYDIHQIEKVYDGAAGNATVTIQLSNSSHYVPCDSDGNVTSWNGSPTQVFVYEGGQDVTSSWSITANRGRGLEGSYDANTHVFTPSALTLDTSYCDFVCTKQDYSTMTVRYTITKTRMGADGKNAVIYSIEPSVLTINQNESGVFTPTSVTFNSYMRVGDALNSTAYEGRIRIQESTDGSTFTTKDTSSKDEATKTWSPSGTNVVMIKGILFEAGTTTNILDEQTVVITRDGKTGKPGEDGVNGISMGLGNYQDVLPCDSRGYTSAAKDITIPFYAYSGIQKIPVTAIIGDTPTGITVKSNTAGDATKDGQIVLTVANGSPLGNASWLTGDINIRLTCTYNTQTQSVDQKYTWTKNVKAVDGAAAVILEIYSEDGGIIKNSEGSTTLKTRLISGASEVTPATVQWAKYQGNGYVDIAGETSTSLEVTPNMVDSIAFFRATASYNNIPGYTAFFTVSDISDPVQCFVFATVQEFKNSQGYGAIYTRVYRNKEELDPIKSTVFSNTAPTSATKGDFYYYLNPTNKTCTLKKYNGTSWADATETDTLNYAYYRIDNAGNAMDTTPFSTKRCIYVDPTMINGRMQFICEVTD